MRRGFHCATSSYSSFNFLRAECGVLTMNTSAHLANRSSTSCALAAFRLSATPRLFRFDNWKGYGTSECGWGGIFCPFLHSSPSGGSTLMTSAPKSDRIVAAPGPAMKLASSTTLKPEKMFSSAIKSPCRKIESGCNSTFTLDCTVSGALAPLELWGTLCKKGGCSFLLVFGPRANREQQSFKEQALREARIQPLVYRLNRVLHADWCVGDELVEYRFCS